MQKCCALQNKLLNLQRNHKSVALNLEIQE